MTSKGSIASKTIVVKGVPIALTLENLTDFILNHAPSAKIINNDSKNDTESDGSKLWTLQLNDRQNVEKLVGSKHELEFNENTYILTFKQATASVIPNAWIGKEVCADSYSSEIIESVIDGTGMELDAKSFQVKLTGLPPDVDKEYLDLYFADEDEFEDCQLLDIVLNENGTEAVIDVKSQADADRIIEKQPFDMEGTTVSAEINLRMSYPEPLCTIEVTGPPGSDIITESNKRILNMYFRSRGKSDGGKITNMTIDSNAAYITYETAEVAQRVVAKEDHKLRGQSLTVRLFSKTMDEKEELTQPSSSLLLSNLPDNIDSEYIELYFDDEELFDEVLHVQSVIVDESVNTAIVQFGDYTVVAKVLEKQPLQMEGQDIQIQTYIPAAKQPLESDEQCTIEVHGPTDVIAESNHHMLTNYFKSQKRSSGGEIVNSSVTPGLAYFTFKTQEVAKRVVEQRKHEFRKTPLEVILRTSSEVNLNNMRKQTQSEGASNDAQTTRINVSGIPPGKDEEFLSLFFENIHDSITVKEVAFYGDNSKATVKFSEPDEVNLVMQHLPLTINEHVLEIQKLLQEKMCTVAVRGLTNIQKEMDKLELYFKHRKSGGGSTIVNSWADTERNIAYFTYEEEDVARRVSGKTDHVLRNQRLEVSLCTEQPTAAAKRRDDQQVISTESENKEQLRKVRITNLPESIDETFLEVYLGDLEEISNFEILSLEHNPENCTAVIEFDEPKAAELLYKRRTLDIKERIATVEIFQPSSKLPSRTIAVSGIPDIEKQMESLEMYFTGKKSLGNSQVLQKRVDKERNVAYFTYESEEVAKRVAAKESHVFARKQLNVSLYNEEESSESRDSKTILISNLPESVDEKFIELFFDQPDVSGDLNVVNVTMNQTESSAVVEFDAPEALYVILEKQPLVMKGKTIAVKAYSQLEECTCTIEVTGIPDIQKSLDALHLYFETKHFSGGGKVVDYHADKETNKAYFTFESGKVTRTVVERKHTKFGKEMKVRLIRDSKPSESDQRSNTVKISGVKNIAREILQYYFENKLRSGGGKITYIEEDIEDDNVIYIKFTNSEDADAVSEKSHNLQGHDITAFVYFPPPCYDRKLLIKGVALTTTKDGLFNFLEAKTSIRALSIAYHEEEDDIVVVTMEKELDFEKLTEACKTNPLEGAHLKVAKIPISNCIYVTNLASDVTEDTVRYYFESSKGGGGKVDKVAIDKSAGTCLVHFEDYKVVDGILQKQHHLSNRRLNTKRYQVCLKGPEEDTQGGSQERQFLVPSPVEISFVEKHKIRFCSANKLYKERFEAELEKGHATVIWPEKSENLRIQCTLSTSVKRCFKLANTWREQVEDCVKKNFEGIALLKVAVLRDIWDNIMESIRTISIDAPEHAAIFPDRDEGAVIVVGRSDIAEGVCRLITENVQNNLDILERERQKVKEDLKICQPLELRLMNMTSATESIQRKFENLQISINEIEGVIVLEGPANSVKDATLEVYRLKNTFVPKQIHGLSNLSIAVYQSEEARDFIQMKLEAMKIQVVWEVCNGSINIICMDNKLVDTCVEILRDCVVETEVSFEKDTVLAMETELWLSKVNVLHSCYRGKVEMIKPASESKVVVCATEDINEAVMEEVHDFIESNKIITKHITGSRDLNRLLEKHHRTDFDDISRKLTTNYVEISMTEHYGGFQIRGLTDGVELALKEIQALQNKVKKRKHTVIKPGIAEHMRKPKGKDGINTIETITKCIVTLAGGDNAMNYIDNQSILASCKIDQGRQLITWFGDMTDLDTDILVSPVDEDMRLLGGLGKAILSKGGMSIQEACEYHIKNNGKLKNGEVFISQGGNSNAKFIAHISSPEWRGGQSQEIEILEESVFSCLTEATKKNVSIIAIPAIGCGVNGFPRDVATKSIVKTVRRFFMEIQSTSLTEVYLCDQNINTVKLFTQALCQEFGSDNVITAPSMESIYGEGSEQNEAPSGKGPRKTRFPQAKGQRKNDPIVKSGDGILLGKVWVTIVKGEIANEKTNVIVNTTSRNLDLQNGSVSLSLLNAAGTELQKEVNAKYPNGLTDINIAVTSGQNLGCKEVIHTATYNYDDKKETECRKGLYDLVTECLDEIERRGHSSASIPAIGTGQLGYPHTIVAEELYKAVVDFSKGNPNPSLTEIHFIVYHLDKDSIQAFEKEQLRLISTTMTVGRLQNQDAHGLGYDVVDDFPTPVALSKLQNSYMFGNVKVTVKGGDLLAEDAECIVNSTNIELDLSIGAVSRTLLKKGGHMLQADIDSKRKTMESKKIVITKAPNLPCENIIHVVVDQSILRKTVEKCLKKAEKRKMKSIAFPALAAGLKTSGALDIAQDMVEAVKDFVKIQPKHLKDIRLVIFHKVILMEFEQTVREQSDPEVPKSLFGHLWTGVKGFLIGKDDEGGKYERDSVVENSKPDVNSVTFCIISLNNAEIDKAINKLDQFVRNEVETKTFDDYIIQQLDKNQVIEMAAIARQHFVEIEIDQAHCQVKICGMKDNFYKAYDKMQSFIKDAIQMDYMSNIAQWYVINITEIEEEVDPYERDVNLKIETAYKQNHKQVGFSFAGKDYIVDFETMEEYPEDKKEDKAKVIRRNVVAGGSFELPPIWDDMKSGNLRVVELKHQSAEYKDLEQKFLKSSQNTNYTVTKIERIQNVTLWEQHQSKKKQLDERNKPNTQNERMLWHGTKVDATDSINAHGFNRSFCGQNAVAFGNGVYFAVDAEYSCSDTYSVPDSKNIKRMYYCRVLTGEYALGSNGLRTPPVKPGGGPHCLYDSVVNDIKSPKMFIVFNDTQAYPEYLLYFK